MKIRYNRNLLSTFLLHFSSVSELRETLNHDFCERKKICIVLQTFINFRRQMDTRHEIEVLNQCFMSRPHLKRRKNLINFNFIFFILVLFSVLVVFLITLVVSIEIHKNSFVMDWYVFFLVLSSGENGFSDLSGYPWIICKFKRKWKSIMQKKNSINRSTSI